MRIWARRGGSKHWNRHVRSRMMIVWSSVVTHDIEAHHFAVGVPCRARRAITAADTLFRDNFRN